MFVAKKSGSEVGSLEPGDCFGEECFLGEDPDRSRARLMTVCCITHSEALSLDRNLYDAICMESPGARKSLANVQAVSDARAKRFLAAMLKPRGAEGEAAEDGTLKAGGLKPVLPVLPPLSPVRKSPPPPPLPEGGLALGGTGAAGSLPFSPASPAAQALPPGSPGTELLLSAGSELAKGRLLSISVGDTNTSAAAAAVSAAAAVASVDAAARGGPKPIFRSGAEEGVRPQLSAAAAERGMSYGPSVEAEATLLLSE